MNKKTRFAGSDGYIINDLETKNKIIDYLFNSLDLAKYRYIMLNNLQKLKFLKQNPHHITPNYKGYTYLLIFMKIKNVNHCVAIDRRKMSYHKDKVNVKNIYMVKVKVNVSDSIFRGTIFDCKLIFTKKDNKFNNYMLIKDCMMLMGNSLLDMEMGHKMTHINSIINNQFTKHPCPNFVFKVNKLYKYNEIETLINDIIPACSIPVQGLVFYPKFSGVTIIYIKKEQEKIEISNKQNVDDKSYHMIYNLPKFLKSRLYSYESSGQKKRLWIRKTEISDVYDVLENKDNNRLGIAHIPNLKISHLCKENIKDESVKFLCTFNKKFKKWIPIKL
jgi:hypothetical protein